MRWFGDKSFGQLVILSIGHFVNQAGYKAKCQGSDIMTHLVVVLPHFYGIFSPFSLS